MLRKIAVYVFNLSNIFINRLKGNYFAIFFNTRSKLLNLSLRVHFDGEYYKLTDKIDKEFTYFFKAEKQGNMAYGKGLKYRLNDLKKSYFLDVIDFSDGDTFIDCGANVGDLYLVTQKMDIDVKYMGFEPSPKEFSCLKKNVCDMPVHNVGLWNEEGCLEFYVASQGADSSLIQPKTFEAKTTVKTAPLKNYVDGEIKCLKLEAEGAEPEILEGLEDKLAYIEYVTADVGFERGHSQDSTLPAVTNYLLQNNFRMISVGQGRLCALYKNKKYD